MKKYIFLSLITLIVIFANIDSNAQIGINSSGAAPAINAMLDVSSTTKGALLPRMSTIQRNALTKSDGLTVYDTDTKSYWFVKGIVWTEMVGGTGGGTSPWTISGTNIYNANTGNVGIGTTTPTSKFNVNGQITIDQKNFGGYGGLLIKGGTPGSNYPNIAFTTNNEDNIDVVAGYIGGEITSNIPGYENMNLQFLTNDPVEGLTERLKIRDNGNIGVGINPSYKFHIGNSNQAFRIEGPEFAGGTAMSIGGLGNIVIDKPGIVGGRFTILENGNTGIGQNNPGFPLNFSTSIGDKISLFGTSGNHYGFGIQSAQLQIHTGAANEDITFGYGSSGAMTEKFRFKGNGAFAVNGDVGQPGQFLTSGGPNAPASWNYQNIGGSPGSPGQILMSNGPQSTPTWKYNNQYIILPEVSYVIPTLFDNDIPGATFSFTAPSAGKLVIWLDTRTNLVCLDLNKACTWVWHLKTQLNNVEKKLSYIQVQNLLLEPFYDQSISPIVLDISFPGVHTVKFIERLVSLVLLPEIKISGFAQFIPN